jgi:hypothetical protein
MLHSYKIKFIVVLSTFEVPRAKLVTTTLLVYRNMFTVILILLSRFLFKPEQVRSKLNSSTVTDLRKVLLNMKR